MVLGIDSFREKFKDYTDCYTIIGGTACDILLAEANLPFRATKDIDMIASVEDIVGTIQNGELFFDFTDDDWGGAGTLHITFLPNQINVEVLNFQNAEENASGYGISGIYEMSIRE